MKSHKMLGRAAMGGVLLMGLTLLTVGLLLSMAPPGRAQGSNGNPGVLPPNSKPYGKTYGEWGAEWWKWAEGIPLATNPVADTTGAF